MIDLSVLSKFTPVDRGSTKNSSGAGIDFESELDPFLKSDSKDADELAKIIQEKAESKSDEAEQLKIIERSLAYIRAKVGSDLSSEVYEKLKNKDSDEFIDVFGKSDEVPSSVEDNTSAKAVWEKIMTGAAFDHIEDNKTSIEEDLESARDEADDEDILKISDNQALIDLKEELMESGMTSREADKDISEMLRETKTGEANSEYLITEDESVEIEIDNSSSTLSDDDSADSLETLRDDLTTKIDKADSTAEVQEILERSVDDLEKLRPDDDVEPELFYTEQMQAILDKSEKYKDYTVAANPSLEKIEVDGEELILTDNDKVYVNSSGEFTDSDGEEYTVNNNKITVDGDEIDIEDIKPSEPEISVFMDKDSYDVEDETLKTSREYVQDQKLVHKAREDDDALEELDKADELLDETEDALITRRENEKEENKEDNNDTLQLIVGIISAVGTVVAALSQGRGTTTTITPSAGYNRQNQGYYPGGNQNGYTSGNQGGYGYDSYYPVSDKYGYNRGYQATVDAAYERSEQYLSTFRDNPVGDRARIMRQRGMAAIQGQDGGFGVYNT